MTEIELSSGILNLVHSGIRLFDHICADCFCRNLMIDVRYLTLKLLPKPEFSKILLHIGGLLL